MNITLDTETTGLPPKNSKWETDYNRFPYIVQLSWKRSDNSEVMDFIINNKVDIPEGASKIHGITTEIAAKSPYSFVDVMDLLINDLLEANLVIGHNLYFDTSIIKANVLRFMPDRIELVNDLLHKSKRIDTMQKTIKFCDLENYKWPKLTELHYKLFKKNFPAHDSKEDVIATEKCYLELVRRGIV